MNPDLLSANVSLALMAIVAIAALAHLSQLGGRHRLQHAVYAATALGLLYLFGGKALGWSFLPREALMAVYAGLFLIVAALAALRPNVDLEAPWTGLLIELAAMAYIFAPLSFWKPPISALLLLYFVVALFGWLKGREQPVAEASGKDHRPPLFPPERVRGVKEIAAAAATVALVYIFAMGTGRAPVAPPPEEQAAAEQPAESVASAEATPDAATEAKPDDTATQAAPEATTSAAPEATASAAPEAPPAEKAAPVADTYTANAGDTLKSIAKKLYGKANKLSALTAANPGVKATAKLKTGQIVKLPEPPTARP